MNRRRVIRLAALWVVLPVLTGVVSGLLLPIGPAVVVVICASALIIVAVERVVKREQLRKFHAWRGVLAIADDRNRVAQFSELWDKAESSVSTWGVGMTNLSLDTGIIERTVARGCKVVIEMIDPEWVRANAGISELLDAKYNRRNFLNAIEESYERLLLLTKRLNRKYGEDSIELWVMQTYDSYSGTVADAESPTAWGYVEFHIHGFPYGQIRLLALKYPHEEPLNPPTLEHVLLSRLSIPRRRVDNLPPTMDPDPGPESANPGKDSD